MYHVIIMNKLFLFLYHVQKPTQPVNPCEFTGQLSSSSIKKGAMITCAGTLWLLVNQKLIISRLLCNVWLLEMYSPYSMFFLKMHTTGGLYAFEFTIFFCLNINIALIGLGLRSHAGQRVKTSSFQPIYQLVLPNITIV